MNIEATSKRMGTTSAARAQSGVRQADRSRLRDGFAWAVLALVALAPIPFGSNRPFFWALWAIVIGVTWLAYLAAADRNTQSLRLRMSTLRPGLFLGGLVLAYLLVQMLPLGSLVGPVVPLEGPAPAIWAPAISIAPGATQLMALRWATYGLFVLLVLQLAVNPARARTMLAGLFYVVAAHAVFGLSSLTQFGDTLLGAEKWAYQGVATGTFVNRNSFATLLAFGLVIGTAKLADAARGILVADVPLSKRIARLDPMMIVDLVCLALIVATLLATRSRMGAFAATGGVAIVLLLAAIQTGRPWRLLLLGLPIIAGTFAILLPAFGEGLLERLGSVEHASDDRLELYAQVLEMIAARPLTGYGGGSFEIAFPLFHRPPVSADMLWDKAHNTYLALWAELGIVFGSLPLLMAAVSAWRLTRGLKTAGKGWLPRASAVGCLAVAGLHSLVDFSLEIQAVAFFFLAVLGLGLAQAIAKEQGRPG